MKFNLLLALCLVCSTTNHAQSLEDFYNLSLDVVVANLRYDLAPVNILNKSISDKKERWKADLIISTKTNTRSYRSPATVNNNRQFFDINNIELEKNPHLEIIAEDMDGLDDNQTRLKINGNDHIVTFDLYTDSLKTNPTYSIQKEGHVLTVHAAKTKRQGHISTLSFERKPDQTSPKLKIAIQFNKERIKFKTIKSPANQVIWVTKKSYYKSYYLCKGDTITFRLIYKTKKNTIDETITAVFDNHLQIIPSKFGTIHFQLDIEAIE